MIDHEVSHYLEILARELEVTHQNFPLGGPSGGIIVTGEVTNSIIRNLRYMAQKVTTLEGQLENLGVFKSYIVPKVGQVWEHYKGNHYHIDSVSLNTETLLPMVTYTSLEDPSHKWVRALDMFIGTVALADGSQVKRYNLVQR